MVYLDELDPRFRVICLARTQNPQRLIYAAMHQDYSQKPVALESWPNEEVSGELIVKRLLAGERGHYGPLEHPQISFNCCYFPHSVIQQARTHRISVSFDAQSMRYTGQQVLEVAAGTLSIEDVFYLRPVGHYSDRQGKKYEYTETQRQEDLMRCFDAAKHYAKNIQAGHSEEHARGNLPFDYRQHFVVSFNLRSLMHFLDLRSKKDAQIEIQALCDAIWPHFLDWTPAIARWYETTRLGKARLAP